MNPEPLDGLDFTEAVLSLVEEIPPGRVLTYGLIAERLGCGGPRQVGGVMARDGHAVPWWRVVRADGLLPAYLMGQAQQEWSRERTPVKRGRVDITQAVWSPAAGPENVSAV
ncbi:MAG: MGMT family protein [Aeromicrobium sp.]|uniref:MGMT family protein n=1 Tax=Aeromicrobium sp. TaxID=1871063 RepID=UPI0039E27846